MYSTSLEVRGKVFGWFSGLTGILGIGPITVLVSRSFGLFSESY